MNITLVKINYINRWITTQLCSNALLVATTCVPTYQSLPSERDYNVVNIIGAFGYLVLKFVRTPILATI